MPAVVIALALARWLRGAGARGWPARGARGRARLAWSSTSTVNERLYGGLTPYAARRRGPAPARTPTPATPGRAYRAGRRCGSTATTACCAGRRCSLLAFVGAVAACAPAARAPRARACPTSGDVEVAAGLLVLVVRGPCSWPRSSRRPCRLLVPGAHLVPALPLRGGAGAWALRHVPRWAGGAGGGHARGRACGSRGRAVDDGGLACRRPRGRRGGRSRSCSRCTARRRAYATVVTVLVVLGLRGAGRERVGASSGPCRTSPDGRSAGPAGVSGSAGRPSPAGPCRAPPRSPARRTGSSVSAPAMMRSPWLQHLAHLLQPAGHERDHLGRVADRIGQLEPARRAVALDAAVIPGRAAARTAGRSTTARWNCVGQDRRGSIEATCRRRRPRSPCAGRRAAALRPTVIASSGSALALRRHRR